MQVMIDFSRTQRSIRSCGYIQTSTRCLLAAVVLASAMVQGAKAQAGASTQADIPPSRSAAPPPVPLQLNMHFTGHWTGALESQPLSARAVGSPHTSLPARLVMRPSPDGRAVNFAFTYRSPAGATTHERMILSFTAHTALLTGTVNAENLVFRVRGLDAFRPSGYGTLILTGQSTENGKSVEVQETLTLQPREFTWLKQTRPVGASSGFVFSSRYVFTRDAESAGAPLP